MKKTPLLLLTLIILLCGCLQPEVTCNKPYIKFGTSCCLDINNNNICDTLEPPKTQKTIPTTIQTTIPTTTHPPQQAQLKISDFTWAKKSTGTQEYAEGHGRISNVGNYPAWRVVISCFGSDGYDRSIGGQNNAKYIMELYPGDTSEFSTYFSISSGHLAKVECSFDYATS